MRTIVGLVVTSSLGIASIGPPRPRGIKVRGPAGILNVEDDGAGGVPVVFVPCHAGSTEQWHGQLSHLRRTRRAIAIDLRGHGRSEAPARNDYAIESLAGDLAAVLDQLDLPKVILVGHGMGGAAALAYAGRHPDRVAGLVLVAMSGRLPAAQAGPVPADDHWARLLAGSQPNVKAQVERDRERIPEHAVMAMIEATTTYDPAPALCRYRGPTRVITTPTGDRPFDLQPGIVTNVVTGTSHWIQLDKPRVVNSILDAFLATLR